MGPNSRGPSLEVGATRWTPISGGLAKGVRSPGLLTRAGGGRLALSNRARALLARRARAAVGLARRRWSAEPSDPDGPFAWRNVSGRRIRQLLRMAAQLAPYLRYYASRRPTDDHGTRPAVLVVFEDELAASHFLRVAREEANRTGVEVPLRVSHRRLLPRVGPLGEAWAGLGTTRLRSRPRTLFC